jgi:hypothetical protein
MRARRAAGLAMVLMITGFLAVPSAARDRPEERGRPQTRGFANPSALIAAELAVERVAVEKGQWLAFRQAAAPGAMLALPGAMQAAQESDHGQPLLAEPFLKDRAEPVVAMEWQVHAVWSSCDGSYGVTRGAYHGPEGSGSFVTVWQRQEKNVGYKWLLRLERALAEPPPEPEMISALVADCPKPGADGPPAPPAPSRRDQPETAPPINPLDAASDDDTFSWTVSTGPDGARQFVLKMRRQGEMRLILDAY